jgi:hypothetical protein
MPNSAAAIKDVTTFLRQLLLRQLLAAFQNAEVTLLPPGNALPNVNGANLYLYRVVESPFTKNQDWRGNRDTPPSSRPVLGLQLSYLVTPLSVSPDAIGSVDNTHLSLGIVMLALHENPILNDVHLPAIAPVPAVDADTLPEYVRNSYEQVKITLLPTSVDEISRIWATLNQPYRLSVAYEVSLVELFSTPPPAGGGIVFSTGVDVITLDPPRLELLNPTTGGLAREVTLTQAVVGNDLRIDGFGLSFPGQTPVVHVGGKPVVIKDNPIPTNQSLTVTLPLDLDAGPQADVRVTLNGRTSTPLVFTAQPWLQRMTPIRTALDPDQKDADLKLTLQGSGFTPAPLSVRFERLVKGKIEVISVTVPAPDRSDTSAKITIPTTLENGSYDVRLVTADGSASNKRTLEVLPLITKAKADPKTVEGIDIHELTIEGVRLKGQDIRLILDGATYVSGENTSPTKLVYTLSRQLPVGMHRLAVRINGHTSRPKDFPVP